MTEYEEAIFIVAVYLFVVTAFTLPFLVAWILLKISKTVKRANKVLDFIYENEVETRKYHE